MELLNVAEVTSMLLATGVVSVATCFFSVVNVRILLYPVPFSLMAYARK